DETASGADIFIAKYDGAGNYVDAAVFGDAADQFAAAVAVDSEDTIWVTGGMVGNVDFGGGTRSATGPFPDVFVARFDSELGHLYSDTFGSAGTDIGHAVAVDSSDNVILTGQFQGSIDFGNGAL